MKIAPSDVERYLSDLSEIEKRCGGLRRDIEAENLTGEEIAKRAREIQEYFMQISPVIEYGAMKLDINSRVLYVDGKDTRLTKIEFDLLQYMMQHRGMAMTTDELMNNVWGEGHGSNESLRVHVWRLKRKIGEEYIRAVNSFGYTFGLR